MKKVFYTFALLALSLMSCESDSDNETNLLDPSDNDSILPTKVDIGYSDGETETIEFTYDGMKLIKEESSDSYYTDYIYENNVLTQANYYDAPDDDILESYTYDSLGRVSTVTVNIVGIGVYEYNQTYSADNSVITQSSITYPNTTPSTITISDGNITNFTEDDFYTSTYTYDDKNGVFKNVELREQLVTIDYENSYALNFTLNNLLSETIVDNLSMQSENYSYTMTYTSFDFPNTVEENDDGDITTYTFTYNND